MLTTVTITGADDKTDPAALLALSREFPFVEWGILYSHKRVGTSRYPSEGWRNRFYDQRKDRKCNVSLHLCGAASREVLAGKWKQTDWRVLQARRNVDRVQLNGWAPGADTGMLSSYWLDNKFDFILQVQSADLLLTVANEARKIGGHTSALFDPSGGRGIGGLSYPAAPLGLSLGYAGGIGPDNVLDVLSAIGPVSHDFWIDMESRVRTDDVFDLAKVRTVLERCKSFVP